MILWGEDDRFQLVKYGERLAHARHFVMFDQPANVTEQLLAFLEANNVH